MNNTAAQAKSCLWYGDRVRLSAQGVYALRGRRDPDRIGTVMSKGRGVSVAVRWDGRTASEQLHPTLLELVDNEDRSDGTFGKMSAAELNIYAGLFGMKSLPARQRERLSAAQRALRAEL